MTATLLGEDRVESDWVTFDKDTAEDRMMTSVDGFCESGVLIEHEAESAMEVGGTMRLIEDGEVTEIAVERES